MAHDPVSVGGDNPVSPQQVATAFFSFVKADAPSESRQVLEQHPELLMPGADPIIATFIRLFRKEVDDRAVAVLEHHAGLLRLCREIGVESAFAGLAYEAAILASDQNLAQTSADDPNYPARSGSLAVQLLKRFERAGDAADLIAAIRTLQGALIAAATGHADRPGL